MIVSEPKATSARAFFVRGGDEAISAPGHGGQYPESEQAVPIPSSPVPSRNIKYNTTVGKYNTTVGEIDRICGADHSSRD